MLLLMSFAPAYAQKHGVTVKVKMGNESDGDNILLYNRNHPLTISDFEGRPFGPQVAMTSSGIYISSNWSGDNISISLDVVITTTFDRSRSFFKDEGKNAYILNHEQRHFDITAIEACKLITAIKNYHFTLANYEEELSTIYQKYQNENTERQQQYDDETNHSINKMQQEAWNKKIDTELKEQTCY